MPNLNKPSRNRFKRLVEEPANSLLDVVPSNPRLIRPSGLRRRRAAELFTQLSQDDLLRTQRVAGLDKGFDLFLLLIGEGDPDPPQRRTPLMGSLSALPASRIFAVLPSATDMSCTIWVAGC